LYQLQQGPSELTILEAAARRADGRIPNSIQNAPELRMGLQLYFSGFLDLSNCRSAGMVEGPIPWTAIQAYCVWMELDEETSLNMHYHIGKLDEVRYKHLRSKEEK